jgi:hypothetical protein
VADLDEFGVRYRGAEAHEKFSKRKYFDGAHELNYEFKTPESGEERPLFIFGSISLQQKTSDAMISEGAEKIGLLIGFKKEGVEEREVAGAQRFGDSSTFTVLVKDEPPIGNVFTVRDGKKTYMLVVAGVFFKDPEASSRLIGPKLKRLAAYSPA